MNKIKKFNYEYIYGSELLNPSNEYFSIVLNRIYNTLKECYSEHNTFEKLSNLSKYYPKLVNGFKSFLINYIFMENRVNLKNEILYDISKSNDYYMAILEYMSGMTDKFAIDMYNEIISF